MYFLNKIDSLKCCDCTSTKADTNFIVTTHMYSYMLVVFLLEYQL